MGRRKGGQGIVAFATDANSSGNAPPAKFALKLYSSPSAFDREQAAIMSLALQPAMPACHAIIDTVTSINDGPLAGSVLPPVIVTERGTCLREYLKTAPSDAITNTKVRKPMLLLH